MEITAILVQFGIVLASLTVHECAHAWTAEKLGDRTARMLGRVSLNPVVHIDLIGTVILPLLAMFSGFPILGWAKPVPVDMRNLAHPKRDFAIVAAAGPASNIVLAALAAVAFHATGGPNGTLQSAVLQIFVTINILLAVFNMLPVPPLDGGNVLAGVLPRSMTWMLDGLRSYGFIILYVLLLTGVLTRIIMPPVDFLQRLFLL